MNFKIKFFFPLIVLPLILLINSFEISLPSKVSYEEINYYLPDFSDIKINKELLNENVKALIFVNDSGKLEDLANYFKTNGIKVIKKENYLKLLGKGYSFKISFKSSIYSYGEKNFYSFNSYPKLPKNLAKAVSFLILGNSTFYEPMIEFLKINEGYEVDQILRAYNIIDLHNKNIKGKDTKIAIVVAYGNPNAKEDLVNFSSINNLPEPKLSIIYPTGEVNEIKEEWAILTNAVLQMIHSISPLSEKILIVAKDDNMNLEETIVYSLNNINANVILFPFGKKEENFAYEQLVYFSDLIKIKTEEGTIIVSPSGNEGANIAYYPSSDPYVLSVGGTSLFLNEDFSYKYEIGWNKTSGGNSLVFSIPNWQKVKGTVASDKRIFPDVSFFSDTEIGFKIVYSKSLVKTGGTALSSAAWAALSSLVAEISDYKIKNINSMIYQIGSSDFYVKNFNDIVNGNNGYEAKNKWDFVTGWGSPKFNLIRFLAYQFKELKIDYENSPYSPEVKINGKNYRLPLSLQLIRNFTYEISVQKEIVEYGLIRYLFVKWKGNVSSEFSNITIQMNDNIFLIASYKKQYKLMIISEFGEPFGDGWYDENSTVLFGIKYDVYYENNKTRYVFDGWIGQGISSYTGKNLTYKVKMVSWIIEEAVWIKQYYVLVKSDYSKAIGSGWYDEGSLAIISLENTTYYVNENERYLFEYWILENISAFPQYNQSFEIEVNFPLVIKSEWKKQYKLNIVSYVNNKIIELNVTYGSGWYDENSIASFYSKKIVYISNNTRLILIGYELKNLFFNESSGSVFMDKPYNISFYWKKQYYIKAISSFSKIIGSGWYDENSTVTLVLLDTVYYVKDDVRFKFFNFNLTNYLELKINENATVKFKAISPLTINTIWVPQYYVYVYSKLGITEGSGWYDENSVALLNVYPKEIYPLENNKKRLVFSHWLINNEKYEGKYILVKSPIKAKAVFILQYKISLKFKNINNEEIFGNFTVIFKNEEGNLVKFENKDEVWLDANKEWEITEVIFNGIKYKPYSEFKIKPYSYLNETVTLPVRNVKIIIKDLFNFPLSNLEVKAIIKDKIIKKFTNEKGEILFKNVPIESFKIKFEHLSFEFEKDIPELISFETIQIAISINMILIFLLIVLIFVIILIIKKFFMIKKIIK